MINPFLASLEIPVLNKETITVHTHEIIDGCHKMTTSQSSIKPIEVQKFTKVYKYPNQTNFLKLLTPIGCRLFIYITFKLPENLDYLTLRRDKVMKDLDVSNSSVGKAIMNLMDSGVLAKKSQSEYWVNPYILFVGDRLNYIQKNKPDAINYITDRKPTIIEYMEVPKSKDTIIV